MLEQLGTITFADLFEEKVFATTPNDTFYSILWGMNQGSDVDIDAPEAWDITTGSSSFIVAIVDSGIDKTHPDLASRLVPGYVSIESKTEAQGGDVSDVNGHGTNCAGTAAASHSVGRRPSRWPVRLGGIKRRPSRTPRATFSAALKWWNLLAAFRTF